MSKPQMCSIWNSTFKSSIPNSKAQEHKSDWGTKPPGFMAVIKQVIKITDSGSLHL